MNSIYNSETLHMDYLKFPKGSVDYMNYASSQLKELNKRRKDHLSGKSKSYTFAEVKEYALSKSPKM